MGMSLREKREKAQVLDEVGEEEKKMNVSLDMLDLRYIGYI